MPTQPGTPAWAKVRVNGLLLETYLEEYLPPGLTGRVSAEAEARMDLFEGALLGGTARVDALRALDIHQLDDEVEVRVRWDGARRTGFSVAKLGWHPELDHSTHPHSCQHTHSLWSDGNGFPEMVADWYKSNGYHFLALSDHNVLSQGERWMSTTEARTGPGFWKH